ncbi:hypothetical protein [Lewinella sp. IMCC34191]|uniref:hypothetical protein n=1 Tax=Lewinella sp. IMCC34191 TaxID=2259172 RepID=UPI000E24FB17|nr:hypothetical protein [Lewinella sp. IMCC34191]
MRENPLPLLFLFALIAILPSLARGQHAQAEPAQQASQRAELARIKRMTVYGPHRKNPLAAGRMLVINAAARQSERIKRRRIPRAERRQRRSTFTSVRYREPARLPAEKTKPSEKKSGSG